MLGFEVEGQTSFGFYKADVLFHSGFVADEKTIRLSAIQRHQTNAVTARAVNGVVGGSGAERFQVCVYTCSWSVD